MTILITGGSGFLGAHLARKLAGAGEKVVIYDLQPAAAFQEADNLTCETGDIRDQARLSQLVHSYQVKTIIHLATLLTPVCEENPPLAVDVNCRGAAVVFETAFRSQVSQVIFGSSVAVFNDDPALPLGDERPYGPSSIYGHTKVFVEALARVYGSRKPLFTIAGLRFGWIYGPGRDRGWRDLQAMIEAFARGETVVHYPDYHQALDWTYIEDALQAVLNVLSHPRSGAVLYNVSGDYRTVQDALEVLLAKFPGVQVLPYPAQLPPVGWQFQSDRIKSETGFQAKYTLEAGLAATLRGLSSQ